MVCVGSVGIAPECHQILGSTAATVAEQAHSPVAVIRTPHAVPTSEPDWIAAVVDDTQESDEWSITRSRKPVCAVHPFSRSVSPRGCHHEIHYDDLERRVRSWRHDHPYVHIYPVCIPTDAAAFLAQHDELGPADGPRGR
jgi:hypothetical protein